jgi:hypothetical protein
MFIILTYGLEAQSGSLGVDRQQQPSSYIFTRSVPVTGHRRGEEAMQPHQTNFWLTSRSDQIRRRHNAYSGTLDAVLRLGL